MMVEKMGVEDGMEAVLSWGNGWKPDTFMGVVAEVGERGKLTSEALSVTAYTESQTV